MAKTAIYLHATVLPGSRIELTAPAGMREGDELDVVLLTPDNAPTPPRSLLDILDSLPRGNANFKSAKEVDDFVRNERAAWEP